MTCIRQQHRRRLEELKYKTPKDDAPKPLADVIATIDETVNQAVDLTPIDLAANQTYNAAMRDRIANQAVCVTVEAPVEAPVVKDSKKRRFESIQIGVNSTKLLRQVWNMWGAKVAGIFVVGTSEQCPDCIIIDTFDYIPDVSSSSAYYCPEKMVGRLIWLINRLPTGGLLLYLRRTDIEFSSVPLDKALKDNNVVMKRISSLDDIGPILERIFHCPICNCPCKQ